MQLESEWCTVTELLVMIEPPDSLDATEQQSTWWPGWESISLDQGTFLRRASNDDPTTTIHSTQDDWRFIKGPTSSSMEPQVYDLIQRFTENSVARNVSTFPRKLEIYPVRATQRR